MLSIPRPPQVDRDDTGDDLDATLLLRQQIENSNLPSELKRSALITGPAWDEVLLDVNRTVKVSTAGQGSVYTKNNVIAHKQLLRACQHCPSCSCASRLRKVLLPVVSVYSCRKHPNSRSLCAGLLLAGDQGWLGGDNACSGGSGQCSRPMLVTRAAVLCPVLFVLQVTKDGEVDTLYYVLKCMYCDLS